jgi:hypothetical protein
MYFNVTYAGNTIFCGALWQAGVEMHVCPRPLTALDQAEVFVSSKALDPLWFWFCLLLANVSGSKGETLKAASGKSIKSERIFDVD